MYMCINDLYTLNCLLCNQPESISPIINIEVLIRYKMVRCIRGVTATHSTMYSVWLTVILEEQLQYILIFFILSRSFSNNIINSLSKEDIRRTKYTICTRMYNK